MENCQWNEGMFNIFSFSMSSVTPLLTESSNTVVSFKSLQGCSFFDILKKAPQDGDNYGNSKFKITTSTIIYIFLSFIITASWICDFHNSESQVTHKRQTHAFLMTTVTLAGKRIVVAFIRASGNDFLTPVVICSHQVHNLWLGIYLPSLFQRQARVVVV